MLAAQAACLGWRGRTGGPGLAWEGCLPWEALDAGQERRPASLAEHPSWWDTGARGDLPALRSIPPGGMLGLGGGLASLAEHPFGWDAGAGGGLPALQSIPPGGMPGLGGGLDSLAEAGCGCLLSPMRRCSPPTSAGPGGTGPAGQTLRAAAPWRRRAAPRRDGCTLGVPAPPLPPAGVFAPQCCVSPPPPRVGACPSQAVTSPP